MSVALVEKTFQILESLASEAKRTPLVEISKKTRIPKPTAFRILQTLHKLGYVTRENGHGDYYIGSRLARFIPRDAHSRVKALARPLMEHLFEKFNETINLGILEGDSVYYLDSIETTKPLRWIDPVHSQDPFYCTSLGKAIVAHLPEREQNDILNQLKLTQLTDRTITNKTKLKAILAETRQRGWAIDQEENNQGFTCVGIPLTFLGEPTSAISVTIPTIRFSPSLKKEVINEFKSIQKIS